jgi:two-component system chemotaxis sensor kinase CheA
VPASTNEDEIEQEVLELFWVETREDAGIFQSGLAQLASIASTEERGGTIQELRRIAHKIKGVAATLTLQQMARLAHCLEDLLDLLRTCAPQTVPAVLDALIAGLAQLEAMLRLPPGIEPADSASLDALQASYRALLELTGSPAASTPPSSPASSAPPMSPALLASPTNVDPAATQPESLRLAEVARQHESAESSSEAAQGSANGTASHTSDTPFTADGTASPASSDHTGTDDPFAISDHAGASLEPARKLESAVIEREHSLRVDARRLDALMDLLAQLATSRAATEQARLDINAALAELRPTLQRASQVITQLADYEAPPPERQLPMRQPVSSVREVLPASAAPHIPPSQRPPVPGRSAQRKPTQSWNASTNTTTCCGRCAKASAICPPLETPCKRICCASTSFLRRKKPSPPPFSAT